MVFLLHQDYAEIVTIDEALTRIDGSNFHKGTKKQMRRLVEKMIDCESLAAARKRMKLKKRLYTFVGQVSKVGDFTSDY